MRRSRLPREQRSGSLGAVDHAVDRDVGEIVGRLVELHGRVGDPLRLTDLAGAAARQRVGHGGDVRQRRDRRHEPVDAPGIDR